MTELVPLISMLSVTDLVQSIQPQDCFTSVDLHDTYCHVLTAPEHWCILWFAFQGQAFHFYVMPFSLSTVLFTKGQTTHCPISFTESTEDELVHNWPNLKLYAFAPLSLLRMTLQRIQQTIQHVLWTTNGTSGKCKYKVPFRALILAISMSMQLEKLHVLSVGT